MSKASGKVKKKKIYFCTNVILSLVYTWMMGVGLVLFRLLEMESAVSGKRSDADAAHGLFTHRCVDVSPRAGVAPDGQGFSSPSE